MFTTLYNLRLTKNFYMYFNFVNSMNLQGKKELFWFGIIVILLYFNIYHIFTFIPILIYRSFNFNQRILGQNKDPDINKINE